MEYFYFSDDGDLMALRYDNWKMIFMEQRVPARCRSGQGHWCRYDFPKLFNLRTDPYERADITSNTYWDWVINHIYLMVPAQALVAQMLASFLEFPPRQEAATFGIRQALDKLRAGLPST